MKVSLRIHSTSSSSSPRAYQLEKGEFTIGRDESNTIILADERRLISRRHAMVEINGAVHLKDLDSQNGTFLNGNRIEPGRNYDLKHGDTFRIGDYGIEVRIEETRISAPETIFAPDTAAASDDDSLSRLQTMYAQIAVEAQESDAKALQRLVEEMVVLNELASDIAASFDTQEIVRKIVRRSIQLIGAEQGLITLVNRNEAGSSLKTMVRSMETPGDPFHANAFLLERMRRHRQPILLNDPRRHSEFRHIDWPPALRNVISVPLIVRSEITGVLSIFNKHDRRGFTDSDCRLMSIIAAQSAQVIETARLREEEKQFLQMRRELQVAQEIQKNLLPTDAPDIPGYDVIGYSIPAELVGGDYFDYIPVDDHRWALCVGDVSGKGLPASLLMANVQATLRAQAYWSTSVASCMSGANTLLYRSTGRSMFVTLLYGYLDVTSHRFNYSNAGHVRPLFFASGKKPVRLETASFVLGAIEQMTYEADSVTFAPGDMLVVYSDGVVEAMNDRRELFEEHRLIDVLERHRQSPAETVAQAVLEAVRIHSGDAAQSDDLTVLVVKRRSEI